MTSSDKTRARWVGIFFITATLAGILSAATAGPVNATEYLAEIAGNETSVIIGALCSLIMAAAVVAIAVAAYPVLRRHGEALALGYVAARIVEAMLFILTVFSWLLLVRLSQEFTGATSADRALYGTIGGLLQSVGDWVGHVVLDVVVAPLHYLIFYSLLYRSRIVPRWLSAWGLIGIPAWLIAGILAMSGHDPASALPVILNLPIAVNEMVLAVWLIVKGFNTSAATTEPVAATTT